MTNNNPPKRKSGRPKAERSTAREWVRVVALVEPVDKEWLEARGEIGRQVRAMIDYFKTQPQILDTLLDKAA